MKLYEALRNSKVRVLSNENPPVAGIPFDPNEVVHFHHIDGMYSYCKNMYGDVVHLPAWTEVEYADEPDSQ